MSFSELFVVDLSTRFVVVNGNNVVKRNGLLPNVSSLFSAWDLESDDLAPVENYPRFTRNSVAARIASDKPTLRS